MKLILTTEEIDSISIDGPGSLDATTLGTICNSHEELRDTLTEASWERDAAIAKEKATREANLHMSDLFDQMKAELAECKAELATLREKR